MKNRNFIKTSIVSLLPIAMAVGTLLGVYKKDSIEAKAYTASSLPTTIYLNPTEESEIRDYYSDVSGKNGNDLLKALKPVLMNNQKYYSYDNGDAVWKMYEIIDRDWDKSPASSIKSGTYDISTNSIKNYTYRNDSVEDPYVRALYVNRDAENPKTAWYSHGERNKVETIEREHIWPKSHGFDSGTAAGARGDPMHLWAADGTANGMHSNLFYGNVDKTKTYKDAGNTHNILWGNLTGTSKTLGSGKVFEPQDSDKGDIARACFYMVARYNNLAGNDNNISGANPNLTLSTNLSENDRTGTSTSSDAYSLGLLQDLLEWNRNDPVDAFEIKRNDLLYTNFTKNRNPFIDFPEWADIIWGGASGTADPASDALNGGSDGPIAKTLKNIAITTQPSKTTYTAGENFSSSGMVVTAYYSDNTSKTVTDYTISKTGSLTVADKVITISYGGKNATVRITVNPSSGGETTYTWDLVTSPSELVYGNEYVVAAKDYDLALSTTQNGNNRGTAQIEKTNNSISSPNENVQIFTLESGTKNNSYSFSTGSGYIYAASSSDNHLRTEENKSDNSSWSITFNGGVTNIVAQGTNTRNVLQYNYSSKLFSCYGSATQKPVVLYRKVAHGGTAVHPTGVSLSSSSITLEKGSQETLIATVSPENVSDNSVVWSSNNESVVTVDEFGVVSAIAPGTAVITATAHDTTGGYSASCTVTVPEPIILSSLTISGDFKTSYFVGDSFSTDGIAITAHYSQGGVEVRTEDVTSQCEFEGFDSETSGTKQITVIFEDYSDVLFSVTVNEIPVEENTIKFITSQFGLDNAQTAGTIVSNEFEVTFNNAATKYYDYGSAIRVYGGNSFTISGPKKIVSVSFVFADDSQTNTFSVDKGTCNALTGAWTSLTGEASLTFSLTSGSGHRKIQQIIVKYDPQQSSLAPLSNIELSGNYKQDFTQSDTFSYENLVVTAHYEDNSSKVVSPTSVSGFDSSKTGTQEITVSYTEDQITKTANYMIYVRESSKTTISKTISELVTANRWNVSSGNNCNGCYTSFNLDSNISVSTSGSPNCGSIWGTSPNNDWRLYQAQSGDMTISAGDGIIIGSVMLTFSNSNNGILLNGNEMIKSGVPVPINTNNVTFTVGNSSTGTTKGQIRIKEISLTYLSAGVSLTGISLSGDYQTEFVINNEFKSEGLIVNAVYSDNSTIDVTSAAQIGSIDTSTLGEKIVSVKYDKYSKSYKVNIIEEPILKDYTLSGGKFFTGKYAIAGLTNDGLYNFMKAEIVNSKFGFKQTALTNNKLTIDSKMFEWTIEKNGNYYTLYNEKTESYAASTGENNQGALQKTIDDKALWSITRTEGTDTYKFINKYNEENHIHSILQSYSATGSFGTYYFNKSLSLFRLDDTSFVKVSNPMQITNGSKLTLTGVRDGVNTTFGLGNINDNSKIIATELDWNSTGIYGYQNEEVNCFEVVSVGENFALKTADGKYLYSDSTSTSIYLSSQCSDAQLFTTEVKNGVISIKCLGNNRYLEFNYNSGKTPYFGFYKESSNSLYTNIYVDRNSGEANAWSAEFLKGTQGCTITNWDNYGSSYRDMSFASKTAIKEAVSNQNGSLVEQAAARYDYIVADPRYGVSAFITDRAVAPANRNVIALINIKDNPTMFIILFALAGLTTIGAYIYVKRRKEADI